MTFGINTPNVATPSTTTPDNLVPVQWSDDLASLVVNGQAVALGGAGSGSIAFTGTLAALQIAYPAASNIRKTSWASDVGPVFSNGTAWQGMGPGTLYDSVGVTPPNPPNSLGAAVQTLQGQIVTFVGTTNQIVYTFDVPTATATASLSSTLIPPGSVAAVGQLSGGGTTTNDNASAGQIGEYMETGALPGGTSMTTSPGNATDAAVTSNLVLTAGDWDVYGNMLFSGTATTIGFFLCGLSTVSATIPNATYQNTMGLGRSSAISTIGHTINMVPRRFSIANATTQQVYPAAQANFSGGTMTCAAFLWARRRR